MRTVHGNPKSEARNPKQIRSTKSEIRNAVPARRIAGLRPPRFLSRLDHSDFGFWICFGFRISGFGTGSCARVVSGQLRAALEKQRIDEVESVPGCILLRRAHVVHAAPGDAVDPHLLVVEDHPDRVPEQSASLAPPAERPGRGSSSIPRRLPLATKRRRDLATLATWRRLVLTPRRVGTNVSRAQVRNRPMTTAMTSKKAATRARRREHRGRRRWREGDREANGRPAGA